MLHAVGNRKPNPVAEPADAAVLSDAEVVTRVLAGETPLFEILMRRYNQRMFRVARGIVGDANEAEDVVQEAYVNAYLHLDQFAGRAKFSTWLTRIAVNGGLARLRQSARMDQLDDMTETGGHEMNRLTPDQPDPERQAALGELRTALESAIDALPPLYRSVLVMRDVEELNTAETADCLGLTEEAVKVRLHRARNMMRERLYDSIGQLAPQAFRFDGARCDRIVKAVMERISRG